MTRFWDLVMVRRGPKDGKVMPAILMMIYALQQLIVSWCVKSQGTDRAYEDWARKHEDPHIPSKAL